MGNTAKYFGGAKFLEPRIEQNEQDIDNLELTSSGENLLINGDFTINQRFGTTAQSVTDGYYTDRWLTTGGTGLLHYTTTGVNAQATANGLGACSIYTGTTVGAWYIEQRIEMHASFMNQDNTFSFWMYSDDSGVSAGDIQFWLRLYYGVDGTIVDLPTLAIPIGVSGQWVKYEFTTSVPVRDASKTIHTNDYISTILTIPQKTSSGSSVGFSNAKLELGSVATPFIPDLPPVNLAKCQRYYIKSDGSVRTLPISLSTAQTTRQASVFFPVTMRITPTVTVVAGSGSNHRSVWESTTGFLADGSAASINDSVNIAGYTATAEL